MGAAFVGQGPQCRELWLLPRDHFKCLPSSQEVLTSGGQYRRIDTLEVGDKVVGLGDDWTPRWVQVKATRHNERQNCLSLVFRSGRCIEASTNHPFRMLSGWKRADRVMIGDRVALTGKLPEIDTPKILPYAGILGWFLGDGCFSNGTVTNNDPSLRDDIITCAEAVGAKATSIKYKDRAWTVRVPGLRPLWRSLGIIKDIAGDKHIPTIVFSADNHSIARLLRSLFAADGTLGHSGLILTTKSRQLATDVQRLLLRFDIMSQVRDYRRDYDFSQIAITSWPMISRFYEAIGWIKGGSYTPVENSHGEINTVPAEWRQLLVRGDGYKLRRSGIRIDNKYATSKAKIARVATILDRPDIAALTKDDVYWDEVVRIGPRFVTDTYDIQVEGGSFAVSDIITHNTTILTIAHCVQQILRDPGGSFLILSGKDEHSLLMSDEIRRHFVFNDRLRALFEPWCANTEDQLGSKGEWTSPAKAFFGKKRREPTVTATGFKSRLESKHYKGGYLDDCMGEDDTSEAGLAEARENFKKVIPLIDRDGFVLMPGTRKHFNDLYQGVMDTGAYKVYVRHGLEHPTKKCETDECARYAEPHNAPEFTKGVPLCPERMDRSSYDQKLKECEIDPKRGQSYFWHEYMNIPFSPTDRKFQPAWFVKVDDEQIPGKSMPFYPLSKWLALDSAWKDDEHPSGYDFTVIVVGGFDEFGRLYILDILRSREWTMKQGADAMVTAMKAYGISRVITEKVGQTTFHTYFRDRCRQAGIPVQLIVPKRGGIGSKSKMERIMAAQGPFEQGRVFFRKACDNYDDTINEFCNLGRWTNDDIADAISDFFDEQVKVLAPHRSENNAPPPNIFKPMSFESENRRGAYMSIAVKTNDPLGRFGTAGPALQRFRLGEGS